KPLIERLTQLNELLAHLLQTSLRLFCSHRNLLLCLFLKAQLCFFKLFLKAFQSTVTGILIHVGHDILRKIKDAIQITAGNVQQQPQITRHTAGIPDMRNRCSQVNVTQAFPSDGRTSNFDTTLITDNALVAYVLILATVTLPVARGSENSLAEQPVLFRAQTPVVYCLRFRNFTVGPGTDLFGGC